MTIKSFLLVAIILMQMVNDNPLPQECGSCITFCNEGEKINLLYTVMKSDSFQVDMSV